MLQVKIFNEDNLDIETTVNCWLREHKNCNIKNISITNSKYPCRPIVMIMYETAKYKRNNNLTYYKNEVDKLYDEVERGIISNV